MSNVTSRVAYVKQYSVIKPNKAFKRNCLQKSNKILHPTLKKCIRMARPIPDIDLRDVSKLSEGEIKAKEDRSYFELAIDKISGHKTSRHLVFGTFSGWLAGVTVIKVGKIAAFGLGGGIILLHFASECGYIHVNWDRVRESVGRSQAWMEKIVQFVKKHSCFSVGFVGGFFFGIAST